jgi:hypothetical protein
VPKRQVEFATAVWFAPSAGRHAIRRVAGTQGIEDVAHAVEEGAVLGAIRFGGPGGPSLAANLYFHHPLGYWNHWTEYR